jgi:hypothetical protein
MIKSKPCLVDSKLCAVCHLPRLKEVAPSYATQTPVTPVSSFPYAIMTTADKVARGLGKFFARKIKKRICIKLL